MDTGTLNQVGTYCLQNLHTQVWDHLNNPIIQIQLTIPSARRFNQVIHLLPPQDRAAERVTPGSCSAAI